MVASRGMAIRATAALGALAVAGCLGGPASRGPAEVSRDVRSGSADAAPAGGASDVGSSPPAVAARPSAPQATVRPAGGAAAARPDASGVSVALVVPGKANLGEPAPPFALVAPDDRVVALASYAGRPVVLNFFATWCGPCRAEMPMLQRAHEEHEAAGLAVIGIDLHEEGDLVAPFLAELGVTFPVGLDRHGAVADAYRVATLPTTYFLDASGDVATSRVGVFPTEDELAAALRQILPDGAR